MVTKVASNSTVKQDKRFWFLGCLFLSAGILQYYWLDQSVLLRFVLFVAALVSTIFTVAKTQQGKRAYILWQESLVELRKVVWPTRKETTHMTLLVLVMVAIAGVFLWSIDAILLRLVGWLMGHGGS